MSYAQAKEIAVTAIPVIDMAPLYEGRRDSALRIAQELLAAAQTVGFFYVRNHGIAAISSWAKRRCTTAPGSI